jgi:2-oxoglutarate ferredoxin oxidoreductase subunit delta
MEGKEKNQKTFEGFRSRVPRGGTWTVYPGLCKGCGLCLEVCPVKVIHWSDKMCVYGTPTVEVDAEGCILCHICERICPDAAIGVKVDRRPGEKSRTGTD